MSTGLFADEEDGYNLDEVENIEETKFKLKVPNGEPSTDSLDGLEDFGGAAELGGPEDGMEDFGGAEAQPNDKPFNDEPFEAGVEADEESDPKTFIQQLAGKLGQSLRAYSDEQGQPDFDLEKFAVNSVLSATHTGDMDDNDQSDIIKKVKSSGKGDGDIDVNVDVDTDADNVNVGAEGGDEPTPDNGELDLGDEDVTEEAIDLGISPHNPMDSDVNDISRFYDATVTRTRDNITGKVVRYDNGQLKVKIIDGPHAGKVFYAEPSEVEIQDNLNFNIGEGKTPTELLDNSEKKRTFVGKDRIMNKLHESTEVEPAVKPKTKPMVDPDVKPSRRQKPFRPTIQPKVEPKANDDGVLREGEGTHGKILDIKFLDDKVAILNVDLGDNQVTIKFEKTGDRIRPSEIGEPWRFIYQSTNSPDDKTYTVGVDYLGAPNQLKLTGISDDYIEDSYE